MIDLTRILVVIEGDEATQPALDKAAMLAKFADCELELIVSEYNSFLEEGYFYDPLQAKELRYQHGEHRLAEMEAMAAPLREQGLRVSVSTAWENPPHKGILSRAKMLDASLVIKTTRKHNKLARHFLSNEDWELVRYCPIPLMLVKDLPWSAEPTFIAAIDPEHLRDKPSNLDQKLISNTLALAQVCGGETHLYHSTWKPPLAGLYPLDVDSGRSEKALLALAKDYGIGVEACHCDNEPVTLGLPELTIEIGASAVVMGAISRSRIDRIMIGSTAERLLDELSCDVFIIKPDRLPALNQYLL